MTRSSERVLKVEEVSGYLRVTGYADGSDWLFRPEPPRIQGYGVAGPEHIWCIYAQSGRIQLYHAPTRRPTATAELGTFVFGTSIPVAASRDGRRLFVVQSDQSQSTLKVVDVATGEIIAAHAGLPRYMPRRPVERPDGKLLLEEPGRALILFDPATGERQDSPVPGGAGHGFLSASPDGRYWVRFDPTTLPTRDTTPSLVQRLTGKGAAERLYGLTIQLWEAFPLRFLRRVVVAWVKLEEMPNDGGLRTPADRRAVWEAVAAATAAVNAGPLDSPAPRSAYPAPYSTDDAAWKTVEANLATLARDWVGVAGWQPDGAAWWVSTHSFLSCAGVDGTVSPRLYTERLGLAPGTWLPVAAYWKAVIPLDGRRARVIYAKGEALFDGAASAPPNATVAIPTSSDQWRAFGNEERERTELFRRIAALKDEASTIVIPLGGWTEADCLVAIDALTAKIAQGAVHAASGGDGAQVRIVFDLRGERIGESRFFTEVGERFPAATSGLRRLIEAYVEAGGPKGVFHFDRDADAGVLSRAVRALGVLDRSAIPTLERYGLLVDAEHEYYFAGTTVPDVIKAHGWTDDVVDFVFWVLVRNYYNTLQDYGHIWTAWGLRDAVVHREPQAFARHLVSQLGALIDIKSDPGRYVTGSFDQLAAQIPQPHEPWAQGFFEELERIGVERGSPPDDGPRRKDRS